MTGEHPNGRRAMDDLKRRMVNEGIPPAVAEEKAREVARKNDRNDKPTK
jgi:hypothetical protein